MKPPEHCHIIVSADISHLVAPVRQYEFEGACGDRVERLSGELLLKVPGAQEICTYGDWWMKFDYYEPLTDMQVWFDRVSVLISHWVELCRLDCVRLVAEREAEMAAEAAMIAAERTAGR